MFHTWAALGRVLVIGPLAYLALVLLLRISGKRTLTKLNAFDLVVTVALGSTLATILLSKSVSLTEGVLALALLIALQFAITWTSVRSERVQKSRKGRADPVAASRAVPRQGYASPAGHARRTPGVAARQRRNRAGQGRGRRAGNGRLLQRALACTTSGTDRDPQQRAARFGARLRNPGPALVCEPLSYIFSLLPLLSATDSTE